MSSAVQTSPSVTSPLRPIREDSNFNQTTPTSIKRPRLMASQGKQRKNVRFADTCDEIPAAKEVAMSSGSLLSEDFNVTRTDTENRPTVATEQVRLSGRSNQPANFVRTSPRKNLQVAASPARLAVSAITGDSSTSSSPQIPSPLTPRRSAMKRKAQEPLEAYEHSAQGAFRSPAGRPGSANSSSSGFRLVLSDTNIEPSQEEGIYPSLRKCSDGVTSLCLMMAETSRTSLLARTLREQGITTIGKFASLTPSAVEQIPYLKRPKYENAVAYLKAHIPNNFERESPVTSQERREMNVTENVSEDFVQPASRNGSQERPDQVEVVNKNSANLVDQEMEQVESSVAAEEPGELQTTEVEMREIKEEIPRIEVTPSPDHGIVSLDENADAQPTRSPKKERSAPTTPQKSATGHTPQKWVIPPYTSSGQPTSSTAATQKSASKSPSKQVSDQVQKIPAAQNIDQATASSDVQNPGPYTLSLVSTYAQTSPASTQMYILAQTSSASTQMYILARPKSVHFEQQTTPVKMPVKVTFEQQTTPVKATEKKIAEVQTTPRKEPVHFNLEDSSASVSDVTSSQVGSVLKKKVADLTRLVNNAFPPNSSKPNLTVLESIRNLHTDFQNQQVSRGECTELVSLLLDFAKLANEKAATSEK